MLFYRTCQNYTDILIFNFYAASIKSVSLFHATHAEYTMGIHLNGDRPDAARDGQYDGGQD